MIQTKNCILCGKEAVMHTGHVKTKEGKDILAGFCKEHAVRKFQESIMGYMGKWEKSMGIETEK